MFLEIDQIAVPVADWERVKAGDEGAIERVKKLCDGLELYCHVLSCGDGYVAVTTRELEQADILTFITVKSSQ